MKFSNSHSKLNNASLPDLPSRLKAPNYLNEEPQKKYEKLGKLKKEAEQRPSSPSVVDDIVSSYNANSGDLLEMETHLDQWISLFRRSILDDYQRHSMLHSSVLTQTLQSWKSEVSELRDRNEALARKIAQFDLDLERNNELSLAVFQLLNKVRFRANAANSFPDF